ncbi:flagellar motor switch protein FliM [Planococcus sp. PAMC 21323]|uniref:flagellar motor switch protein FliM n=1 Tax=Planococcus sp. PAMC 21323 TaxID=1526927 RepID=UPI000585F668|nr:flagellar motor switch protein FliM [Planococcus sp. PAMC 21323]AIY04100.1 flagellar motor switch protein FliM [Planococcus sp. PAMC 21323]
MAGSLNDKNMNTILSAIEAEIPSQKLKNRNVRTYDFKKALRFSQDQTRTLTRIHENFARLLTSYFSIQLRTFVQITVSAVEQISYEEFVQNVQKKSILGVFEAAPLQGRMVMEFSPDVANAMFDRLLGGQGNALQKNSDLTEIEITIIERIFVKALESFREVWESVIELTPELREIEINPQFLTISPPNETVILVSLMTKIGDINGIINICLPHVVLEQVLPKLSARHWLANQKKEIENHELEALEQKLQSTKLEIKAILGKTKIDINDFLDLKEGDVIRLNESYNSLVTVLIDGKQKFLAQPGVSKGRLAIQVTDVFTEGALFDDD